MLQTASRRAQRYRNEQQLQLQLQHPSFGVLPLLPEGTGQLTPAQGRELAAMTAGLALGAADLLLGEGESPGGAGWSPLSDLPHACRCV